MKFLTENHELNLLANALSFSSPSLRVTTRIEAYSCKAVARERKTFKQLDQSLFSDVALSISLSPPDQKDGVVDSAFGPLDQKEGRKKFALLILTLNLAYPDYDFTNVRPDEFKKEKNAKVVMAPLSNILSKSASPHPSFSGYPSHYPSDEEGNGDAYLSRNPFARFSQGDNAHPHIHQILDPVIGLFTPDCEVFSWSPDVESDPHAFDSDDEDDETEFGEDSDDDFYFGPLDWDVPSSVASARDSRDGIAPPTPTSESQKMSWFPDYDSSGGLLWSTHYFFYNRKMKRILFLSVWGKKVQPGMQITKSRPQRGRTLTASARNAFAVKKAMEMFYSDASSPEESPPKHAIPLPPARNFKRSASTSSLSKAMGRGRKRTRVAA